MVEPSECDGCQRRRISRTKIQMSQIPPVISVRIASSRKLPKPYFLFFAMRESFGAWSMADGYGASASQTSVAAARVRAPASDSRPTSSAPRPALIM